MEILPLKTLILEKNFHLVEAIKNALKKNKLRTGDVLVVSSKIVALSQGRIIDFKKITPGERAKKFKATRYGHGPEDPRIVELIFHEADRVIPGNMILTLKNGMLIPEAGIDLSNIPKGFAILWPKNPMQAARKLWSALRSAFKVKNLGIVIADSHCQPLRWGTTGLAISWAGFKGVEDARGEKDIYGKKLHITKKAVADNLASGALVVMGEAGEKIPFALIRHAPVHFTSQQQSKRDYFVPPEQCIFEGVYNNAFKKMADK